MTSHVSPPGTYGADRVTLDRVSKRYRQATALDAVSLRLGTGVTGLLGPNGAGKTTLMSVLSTSLPPNEGSVNVFGIDALAGLENRTAIRRRLGFLPQEVEFPRGMSAFGFVDYIAVLKEWNNPTARHDEVRRVLALVGLQERAAAKVRALSGGQRRRLALAQALLGDPTLLILDEPTAGLDPEQRAALRAVISQVAQRAVVLLGTHQTEDVSALCERVVILSGGRIRFDGAVADLVARAAGRVWMSDHEEGSAPVCWRTGNGRFRCVGGTIPAGAQLAEPTLEDAYLLMRDGSIATLDGSAA